jgi:hypothetical protein
MKHPYYFAPIPSGLAAFFYTYDMSHPCWQMGAAVFFTSCTLVLVIRSLAVSNCTEECKKANGGAGCMW